MAQGHVPPWLTRVHPPLLQLGFQATLKPQLTMSRGDECRSALWSPNAGVATFQDPVWFLEGTSEVSKKIFLSMWCHDKDVLILSLHPDHLVLPTILPSACTLSILICMIIPLLVPITNKKPRNKGRTSTNRPRLNLQLEDTLEWTHWDEHYREAINVLCNASS